jgi:hypothetical protein
LSSQTAYAQFKNVVVFIFPTDFHAKTFIQQLEMKQILDKLKIPKGRRLT